MKNENQEISCPSCTSGTIGRIGSERYYCHDCCVEFESDGNVYAIDDDGNLISLQDAD